MPVRTLKNILFVLVTLVWQSVFAQQPVFPAPVTPIGTVTLPQGSVAERSALTGRATIPLIDEDYAIGPQDLLRIEVFQVEDFSRSVRVSSRGQISLPLIGIMQAGGLTAAELEQLLAERLSRDFLQNPYVTVFIEEYTSQRVTIDGEVKRPGIYALVGRTSLLQAVALAEGFEKFADSRRVQLFRTHKDGTRETLFYDVDAIRKGELDDPMLKGDDVVVVQKRAFKSALRNMADALRGFIFFGGSL